MLYFVGRAEGAADYLGNWLRKRITLGTPLKG